MTILTIALLGLRHRAGGFLATFLAAFLGAAILMAFASMLDTAAGPGVDALSRETLVLMTTVAGGWCLLIVVFAVASTLTLAVRQRAAELALLRSVGATPSQVRHMIIAEAAAVALVATAAAAGPAFLLGRAVFGLLRDTEQVTPGVPYRFGPVALGMGVGVTLLGAVLAALLTARRLGRMGAARGLREASVDAGRLGRRRLLAARLLLAAGLGCATVTATVMRGKGVDAMQTAGQASIWFAIGLALLAPALLRGVVAVLARLDGLVLGRRGGAGTVAELAVTNLRQGTGRPAAALMPVILFVGIAAATVSMQRVENRAVVAAGAVRADFEKSVETLNYVVVGMIALFAAIMLVNTLVAATADRRREFGQQRLAGATPAQVLTMVGLEAGVLAVTGVLAGVVASLVTLVPYGMARTGSAVPDMSPRVYGGVVAVAVLLTFTASLGAARLALRTPAVVAAAA